MKVAIIHNTYQQPGGEDVVVAEEKRMLENHGHNVVSYQRSNSELELMSKYQLLLQAKDVVYSQDSKREIQNLFRKEKPDVAHFHNTFVMISPSAYEACKEEGVPVVQTLHNFRLLCPGGFFHRDGGVCEECLGGNLWNGIRHGCYRNSQSMTSIVALMLKFHQFRGTWSKSVDGYIALSEFARSKFVEGGLPAEKIHVKPNFLDVDPCAKTTPGEFALFVGRLVPEKGVDVLLSAWKQLKGGPPLLIIGDGPLKNSLEAQIKSEDILNIQILPWMPRKRVLDAIKKAAVLIVPSTWYEGFPMTVVEAFACGTPVICSRLGSLQEIVVDGHNGLHFAAGDPTELANKVRFLFANCEKTVEMGLAARRQFDELYTEEKNYVQLMDIYARTIAASSRN